MCFNAVTKLQRDFVKISTIHITKKGKKFNKKFKKCVKNFII